MVKTANVTDRRKLRFNTIDEMMADASKIEAAHAAGALRHSGNWTPGQLFGHLATWIDYGFDGAPMRVPWFVKLISRMMKKKFIRGSLEAGFKIPRVEGGTFGIEVLPFEEGMSRFRKSWARLQKAPPPEPNPVFGPLTHEEWIQLHLRHAELHMSFLHPETGK